MYREAPSTDHDLLLRIWTILEGTNGSGLITRFSCIEDDVKDIKRIIPTLWTKEEHVSSQAELATRRKERRISNREWMLIGMTVVSPIIAIVIAHFVK